MQFSTHHYSETSTLFLIPNKLSYPDSFPKAEFWSPDVFPYFLIVVPENVIKLLWVSLKLVKCAQFLFSVYSFMKFESFALKRISPKLQYSIKFGTKCSEILMDESIVISILKFCEFIT